MVNDIMRSRTWQGLRCCSSQWVSVFHPIYGEIFLVNFSVYYDELTRLGLVSDDSEKKLGNFLSALRRRMKYVLDITFVYLLPSCSFGCCKKSFLRF